MHHGKYVRKWMSWHAKLPKMSWVIPLNPQQQGMTPSHTYLQHGLGSAASR